MLSCGVCASVCVSVCVSVMFMSCVKMNKYIIEIFSPSSSQAILVFPWTGWRYSDGNPPNGGVECKWGRQKTRFWAYSFHHISGFGIYGGAVVPDSGVGNTWQRLTLVLHEFLSIWLYWRFVYWCLQHIYRVTLIGVFLGHFCINLHQTHTQYSNEGQQHWSAAQFSKQEALLSQRGRAMLRVCIASIH